MTCIKLHYALPITDYGDTAIRNTQYRVFCSLLSALCSLLSALCSLLSAGIKMTQRSAQPFQMIISAKILCQYREERRLPQPA